MLDAAGLTALEEATYRTLVAQPSASVPDLRSQLGCKPSALAQALHRLETLGLVSRTPGRPSRYVAAPPDVAIEPLVLAQQVRLEQARAQAVALMDGYRAARRDRGTGELVEVVLGLDAIAQRFEQLQRSARRLVCAFVTPPFLTDRDDERFRQILHDQLGRAVQYRTVYDQEGFAAQGGLDAMLADAAAGEEVRLADRLPIKLFLVDDTVALVPMTGTGTGGDRQPGAVVVHPSGLLTALIAFFSHVWQRAAPLAVARPGTGAALDADARKIIAMLRTGFTDAAMARHLGASTRTVQRRIRELMEVAGVRTRFQLGCRATGLGWITSENVWVPVPAMDGGAGPTDG